MNLVHSKIEIGLTKPVKFLHITDTHILDEEKLERKELFNEFLEYADENEMMLVHTGDIITFFTDESIAFLNETLGNRDYLMTIGNHDYCRIGEEGMDVGNVARNGAELAKHFKYNLDFDSRIINGELNVVMLNNAFFTITKDQLDKMKKEVEKGLPIILCMHIPLYTPEHAETRFAVDGCAHLLCVPDEYVEKYPPHCKFQKADAQTIEVMNYIRTEPMIKAILAGHTHINFEDVLESGAVQLTTAAGFDGYAREITVE